MQLHKFESLFAEKIAQVATTDDPAHDLLHFKRVVASAKHLAAIENAKMEVVIPAAWLHDLVIVPKNDPRRSEASRLCAAAAIKYLQEINYPSEFFDEISHAIASHSFSANIEALTLEAKIVQDADRLDGLGAIGIARCFATGALMKRPFYSEEDPFCESRIPNDQEFTADHFFAKLFVVAETLKTNAGRAEGARRAEIMRRYLKDLNTEISEAISNYTQE